MAADRERYRREFESLSPVNRANHAVTLALSFIPPRSTVLEIGCNTGYVSRLLVQQGCTVIGIEMDEWAAGEARRVCEEVFVGDVSTDRVWGLLKGGPFNVALFGDVLEHLADPKPVLERVARLLLPGGFVVISAPNIAHWSVRLALLDGDFDYQATGILDETHLRHYTLKSLRTLLDKSGFTIADLAKVRQPFRGRSARASLKRRPLWVRPYLSSILRRDDAAAFQYVVKAVPVYPTVGPPGPAVGDVRS